VRTDDAGNAVRIWRPALLTPGGPAGDANMSRGDYRRIRKAVAHRSYSLGVVRPIAWVSIVLGSWLVLAELIHAAAVRGALPSFLTVGAGAVLTYLGWSTLAGVGADEVAITAALRAEGRCPSCAYDLAQLASESDGLVTCPECGARWRAADSAGG
jgi:hypothetical protein